MVCPVCAHHASPGDVFCRQCGHCLTADVQQQGVKKSSAIFKALSYFAIYIACQVMVGIIYGIKLTVEYIRTIDPSFNDMDRFTDYIYNKIYNNSIPIMLFTAVLTLALFIIIFAARKKSPLQEMEIKPFPHSTVIWVLLLGTALQLFINLFIGVLPISTELIDELNNQYASISSTNLLLEVIGVVLMTPVLEEIVFRGLIYKRLRKGFGIGASVIISALVFGLMHGAIIAVCYATVLGVILALLTEKYKSILPGILVHAAFNGSPYLLEYIWPNDSLSLFAELFLSEGVIIVSMLILFNVLKRKKNVEEVL